MSLPRSLRDKQAFIEFLRSRGIEPDLRQQNRSLSFSVFPVASPGFSEELGQICNALKTHFIETTAEHAFASRLRAFTYSPELIEIGPPRELGIRLSHRHSEHHVFASANLEVAEWQAASRVKRKQIVLSSVVTCIERVRASWITEEDRADFTQVFLAVRP